MLIDWARPLRTTDDRVARLIASDLGGQYPFAIAVTMANGSERPFKVNEDGICPDNANINLHNLIIDFTVWANVYIRPDSIDLGIGRRVFDTSVKAANNVSSLNRLVGRNEIVLRAVFDDA